MKTVSRSQLMQMVNQPVREILEGLMRTDARKAVTSVTVTDNSTGVAGPQIVPVLTPNPFNSPGGAVLAPRAGFNTATSQVNDALAVITGVLTNDVYAKLGLNPITAGNGNIATPRTIAAIAKTLQGTDGTGVTGLLRSEASACVTNIRNNLAVVVRAYNSAAGALGVPFIQDNTGGVTVASLVLAPFTPAPTGAGSTGDLVSLGDANAALGAMASDVAFIAAQINNSLVSVATLSASASPVLIP